MPRAGHRVRKNETDEIALLSDVIGGEKVVADLRPLDVRNGMVGSGAGPS